MRLHTTNASFKSQAIGKNNNFLFCKSFVGVEVKIFENNFFFIIMEITFIEIRRFDVIKLAYLILIN